MSIGFETLVLYLVLAAAAAWAGERITVPYPVLLVGAGVLLGIWPFTGLPGLSPDVVFLVFLPPLLYYAAFFMSPADLRAHARPIGLLAVGLIVVTTAAVAAVLILLVPGMPLSVAVIAGAVVAPTDPVAASLVLRRLNVPERLQTIIGGEGLINDGAALVLYGAAVAAVVTGGFDPGRTAQLLFLAPAGGAALGFAIAWMLVRLRRHIDVPLAEITISLSTPYLAYLLAEATGLSGVLATVVAGVYVGSQSGSIYEPTTRLQAFAFLEVLVFLLNAILFTLVGVQLARIVHRVPNLSLPHLIAVVTAVVAVVIGTRLAWIFIGPAMARLMHHAPAPATWREGVVVGWSGMRGGVSLAAALALPRRVAGGAPFPYRDLLIVVVGAVIVVTLLLQGMTLPWLLRKLGIGYQQDDAERGARLQAIRAALDHLEECATTDAPDDDVTRLRGLYSARAQRLEHRRSGREPRGGAELGRYRALRLELLHIERTVIAASREKRRIGPEAMRRIQHDLDLEEARLRTL
ncbi:MAG: Na+/H+ antiporter [Streptosporangiaceae bacterium]|jgi:Na+/H+ antiporter|nr:Na+/H+ antiporter [Streptosporangiaceae bacterium]